MAYAAQGNTAKAIEMGITAAAALVGAGAVVGAAFRVARVVRAARAFTSGVEGARASIRASRPIAALAGRFFVGPGARRDVARNGVLWLRNGTGATEVGYRAAARKMFEGVRRWSSNFTVGTQGVSASGKPSYMNFHVTHRSRWW